MSRSYKKHSFLTDHTCKTTKNNKQLANRLVRRRLKRLDELPTNLAFARRMTETWNICDYKWRMTRQEAIDYWNEKSIEIGNSYFLECWPTLDKYLKMWEKYHYRK